MAVMSRTPVLSPAQIRPRPSSMRVLGRYVDWDRIERQLVLSFARHSNLPFFRGIDMRGIPCLQGL